MSVQVLEARRRDEKNTLLYKCVLLHGEPFPDIERDCPIVGDYRWEMPQPDGEPVVIAERRADRWVVRFPRAEVLEWELQ